MNHYQTPNEKFQFINSDGVIVPLFESELPDNMVVSANHVSTYNDDHHIVDIYPITPVIKFTTENLPMTGQLQSRLNIQDLILLIETYNIKSIIVTNDDTQETVFPTDIDIDDARSLLIVEPHKEQDIERFLESLKVANKEDNILDRFNHDDSREAASHDCLNDWVEFLYNWDRHGIYTFTYFSVDVEHKILKLRINEKDKI